MYLKLQNFGVANRAEVIHMEIPPDRSIHREKVFAQSYQDVQDLLTRIGNYYTPFVSLGFSEEWWDAASEHAGVDFLILHFRKETTEGIIAPRSAIVVTNTVVYYMNDQGDTIDKTRV